MSHVEATTGSQTSTFAFASRLKIKSVQLVTVTSCTYLSKSVYYTQQKPRGFRLQTRVEAKKPSAKKKVYTIHSKAKGLPTPNTSRSQETFGQKKVYTIHSKAKGLPTPNTSRSQETFGQKKKCILYTQKPRGFRLQRRAEAKKPSVKNQGDDE